MTSHSYSGLEVVPSADLEVVRSPEDDTNKYPHSPGYATDTKKIVYNSPTETKEFVDNSPTDTKEVVYNSTAAPRRICGLRKRTFWLVVIVAVIVIATAVGGGVGGALATRKTPKSRGRDREKPVVSPSSTVPAQAISTTTIVGPTNSPQPTLLRDCPSSNNTVHSVTYDSTLYQFRKVCNGGYINALNNLAFVDGVVKSLDECINMCADYNQDNRTDIQAGRQPLCNVVCWRNSFVDNDFEGGHCFGSTMRNITVNGETRFSVAENQGNCDSAALINQEF